MKKLLTSSKSWALREPELICTKGWQEGKVRVANVVDEISEIRWYIYYVRT